MKKIISILLSLMMVMCFMPSLAFADGTSISLDGATITLSKSSATYNGTSQEPLLSAISGKLSGGAIDIDTSHCKVVCTGETTSAGSFTVKLAPKDGDTYYTDATTIASFTISPLSISDSSVTYIEPGLLATATSDDIQTAVVVKFGNTTLVKGTDYTIDTSDADLTTHSAFGVYRFNITGTGNFTGTKEVSFRIGNAIDNCTVSTSPTTSTGFTFDGAEKTFTSVTVMNGTTRLTLENDYTIKYDNNTKSGVGTAKMIITGIGSYVGTKTIDYSIASRPMTSVTIENLGNVITGQDPDPKLTYGSYTLKKGTDYNLTYSSAAKSITVTATGQGNFSGTISKTYTTGLNIAAYARIQFYLSPPNYEYTGTSVKPTYMSVVPLISGTTMREGYEYTLSYTNNINVGTATVTVVGIGNYAGTIVGSYNITQRTIVSTDVTLSAKNFTYDGTAKRPTVSVYSGGRTLYQGTDYTVTYPTAVNPGTYNITISGKGNYTGYFTVPYTIGGSDVNSCTASLSQTYYNYTGYACSPTVTLKNGTTTLKNGTDYTVAYSNNTNAGTATATVTGKGMYSGTLSLTYTINGKANSINVARLSYTKYLTSTIFGLTPSSAGDETGFSFASSDNSVATVSASGVVTIKGTGNATITISTIGTKSYNPASQTVTITVKPSKVYPKVYSESKGRLKVRITKKTGVTGYQIRYGRAGSYKYSYMTYANNKYTTQSRTFKGLRSGYKYFVKVRPYKTASDGTRIYGNWSSTKSMRISY